MSKLIYKLYQENKISREIAMLLLDTYDKSKKNRRVSFSLVEVIIINLVLISTNFCTSVYSIAMGMMVNEHKHQIDKAYKKVFTNNPKNHYNARN